MKRIFCLLLVLLTLTGCGCENKEKEQALKEFNEKRSNYVSGIGVSDDTRLVVNYKNKDNEDCYYVFYVVGNSYTQKQITLHNSLESYNNFVSKYVSNVNSELVHDSKLRTSEIILRKNVVVREGNVIDVIKNKYKDSKYKIIESE